MNRIEKEKQIVERMIRLYCLKKEGNQTLCPKCTELWQYVSEHLANCPFGEKKTSCKSCTIHCYKPSMRRRIREVMRYTGPRMLWHAPIVTLTHLFGK